MSRISCLVSAYNADKYLNGRLQNLLCEQTETDIEVLVLVPNSPGLDDAIAQSWAQRDARIKHISLPERNKYGEAWLLMWQQAKSPWVLNANADDRISNEYLKVLCDRLESAPPNIGFAYTDTVVIGEDGRQEGFADRPPFDAEAMKTHCLTGPSVAWLNTPEFKAKLDWSLMFKRAKEHHSAYDYWQFLYMLSLGYHGLSIRDRRALCYYLRRSNSIENSCYGGLSTYQSLCAIAEFFPHVFDGPLKRENEFRNFPIVPKKDLWVDLRIRNKSWIDDPNNYETLI